MLRIDDTDQQRNVEAALAPILHGFRWLGLDWDEGPEVGGPHAPVLPVAARRALPGGRRRAARRGPRLPRLRHAPRRWRPSARRPRRRSGRSCTAAAGWPRPTPTTRALRGRGAQARRAPEDAARGHAACSTTSSAATSSSQWAQEQDHVIQRADGIVPLPPGQRRRRPRLRHHARHPRRGAPVEHAAAGVHRPGARLPAARSTPTCPTSPSRAASASCPSASSTRT